MSAEHDFWTAFPRSLIPVAASRLKSRYSVLVWIAYGTFANRETGETWPSKETIARVIGPPFRLRDVRRCVDELVSAGMLAPTGRKLCGSRLVMAYRLSLGATHPGATAPGEVTPRKEATPVSGCPALGVTMSSTPGPCHPQSEEEQKKEHMGSGEAPHVAARGAGGDEEAPFGRQDQDQEGADAPAGEREVALGRSAYAEVDARADAEEALIAQHRAKQERDFQETCIRDEAEALLKAGLYSTLPPAARLPALVSLTRDYRTRWPRSWPSHWATFALLPGSGVKSTAAWLTTQITGYARQDWIPENKPASERFIHLAIINGDPQSAIEQAQEVAA